MTAAAPAISTGYSAEYKGIPESVTRARHDLLRFLAGCPAADTAALVISELAANAILHTRSAHGSFTVNAELFPGYCWLEVADEGGSWAPSPPGDPLPEDETGRGLHIVYAVSSDVEISGSAAGRVIAARIDFPRRGGEGS